MATPILIASALLLSTPSGQAQKVNRSTQPAILIFWELGMSPEPPPYHLEFAAWADGKVIWCDKPREWVKVNGKWQWTNGKHFEGKIEPNRVTKALGRMRASGAFSLEEWNLYPPDSSFHRVLVRDRSQALQLSSWRDPPSNPPQGRESKLYAKQLRAWNLVWQISSELTPKAGRQIRSPDISKWSLRK
jgi:hypothetical protein